MSKQFGKYQKYISTDGVNYAPSDEYAYKELQSSEECNYNYICDENISSSECYRQRLWYYNNFNINNVDGSVSKEITDMIIESGDKIFIGFYLNVNLANSMVVINNKFHFTYRLPTSAPKELVIYNTPNAHTPYDSIYSRMDLSYSIGTIVELDANGGTMIPHKALTEEIGYYEGYKYSISTPSLVGTIPAVRGGYFHSYKVVDKNGNVKLDVIAVEREDGQRGLYNKVTNTFYPQ